MPSSNPGGAGGGDSILVNAGAVVDADFNAATPAAGAGKVNLEFQTSGTGPALVSARTPTTIASKVADKRTTVTITNSTTQTSIASETIPANSLGGTREVVTQLAGEFLNNSGATTTIDLEVKLGATTMFKHISSTIATSTATRAWFLELHLSAKNSTAIQDLMGTLHLSAGQNPTTGVGALGTSAISGVFHGTGAESTTVDKVLDILITLGNANANITFTKNSGDIVLK